MKRTLILVLMASASLAFAQGGFVTTVPDAPVDSSQVSDSAAWVEGHWVPADAADRKSQMPGPSISQISCDDGGRVCYEKQGNIVVFGKMFSLTADYVQYTVERWNNKEIVASNVEGICRVPNHLRMSCVRR